MGFARAPGLAGYAGLQHLHRPVDWRYGDAASAVRAASQDSIAAAASEGPS